MVDKYLKEKCDACNYDSDKDKVNIHSIKERRFTLCHNCDKIIEHKNILETKVFNMNIFQSLKFRDK